MVIDIFARVGQKFKDIYEPLKKEIFFFDPELTGFISFLNFRRILERLKVSLDNDLIEYVIYLMKNFNGELEYGKSDHMPSLYDLKYKNLLDLLEKVQSKCTKYFNEFCTKRTSTDLFKLYNYGNL